MAKQLLEKITCLSCGNVVIRKVCVIEDLGQFVKINPPLKAALLENFICAKCHAKDNYISEFFEE